MDASPTSTQDKTPTGGITKPFSLETYMKNKPDAFVLGIDGNWYDFTTFLPYHPGGDFIKSFHGKDVSCQFRAFHNRLPDITKRTAIGTYEMNHKVSYYVNMYNQMIKDGLFNTNYKWYAKAGVFTFSLLGLSLVCTKKAAAASNNAETCMKIASKGLEILSNHTSLVFRPVYKYVEWFLTDNQIFGEKSAIAWAILSGTFLGLFFQQAAFLMHDFMHGQVTRSKKDRKFGHLFGTVCVGMNGQWWRDEHFIHHSLPNVVDEKTNFYDVQMVENTWAQKPELFWIFKKGSALKTAFHRLCIKLQGFSFAPIWLLSGRLTMIPESYLSETRPLVWGAFGVHCAWTYKYLASFENWNLAMIAYSTACLLEGVLHIQLSLNHYLKGWTQLEDINDKLEWPEMEVNSAMNINSFKVMDWFWGGLNYHYEHHLFPLLPRHSLAKAVPYTKEFFHYLKRPYTELLISSLFWGTTTSLFDAACQF